jgi:hypothetical protein
MRQHTSTYVRIREELQDLAWLLSATATMIPTSPSCAGGEGGEAAATQAEAAGAQGEGDTHTSTESPMRSVPGTLNVSAVVRPD